MREIYYNCFSCDGTQAYYKPPCENFYIGNNVECFWKPIARRDLNHDKLGLPVTLEEKIVCHADNLLRATVIQPSQEAGETLERRGFPDAARRLKVLHGELSQICGIDIDDISNAAVE